MSRIDPECFPQLNGNWSTRVCGNCFEHEDLADMIVSYEEVGNCSYCNSTNVPTAPFEDIAEHIKNCAEANYGKAADQLPYESREGGYQASWSNTHELLVDDIGIILPNDDNGTLLADLVEALGDEAWCAFDWLSLDPDESWRSSWEEFCAVVKHDRRFYFHDIGSSRRSPDDRSPAAFFQEFGAHIDALGLVKTINAGEQLYRARVRENGEIFDTAAALGPPPANKALQSNRMNPPGIPMFYGADSEELAQSETRGKAVSIGKFETTRETLILDLADLPEVPGFFSEAHRLERYALSFLNQFAEIIILPVDRDDRTHLDYIPTQVFTEFLRDYEFGGGKIDGIRYRSALGEAGTNTVLFATPDNVVDGSADPQWGTPPERWLRLVDVKQVD